MALINLVAVVLTFCCLAEVHSKSYGRGYYSAWGSWGSCHGGCGRGYMERSRSCYGVGRGGCIGKERDRKVCRPSGCGGGHHYYDWDSWGSWGGCDAHCGFGRRYGRMRRNRRCRRGRCRGGLHEYKSCYKNCPVRHYYG